MRMRWGRAVVGAVVIASGVVAFSSGAMSPVRAAMGDCTTDPPPPTTTSTSTTSSTTTSTSTTSTSTTSTTLPLLSSAAEAGESVIVTAPGAGGGPHVKVWDDAESPLAEFMAYEPKFTGGVNVAAGDINGDGHDDVVTAPGPGGGPHVRIFSGAPGTAAAPQLNELGGFMAYEPNFTGGVSVAVGDFNGDAQMDIVTSPGAGGGPHVKIFNGDHVIGAAPSLALIGEFMAYVQTFTGGVTVAAGEMGGDAFDEVVTGAGPGGGPHVKVLEPNGTTLAGTGDGFMAYAPAFRGGVNVAANCANGVARIAVATATGSSHVETYFPDGQLRNEGYTLNPEPGDPRPLLPGLTVAIGPIDASTPPGAQLVTGFADGDPQVFITTLATEPDPLDGFDAYGVVVRVSVAIGIL